VLPSESVAQIERFVFSSLEPSGSPSRDAILKSAMHVAPVAKKVAAKRSLAECAAQLPP
jgi:hypothetical protein